MNHNGSTDNPHWSRHVFARRRLMYSVLIAMLCFAIMPSDWRLVARLLVAWNLATVLYITLVLRAMSQATEASIKRRAEQLDESRFAFLSMEIIASIAALAGIIGQLNAAGDSTGLLKYMHIALAGLTTISAWTFIHLVFAQHYAHEFFIERDSELELHPDDRGGLRFPGGKRPIYSDFVYFSFVIGVACQTADVSITSRPMRRLNLIHCILAFFFNTTILALSINITASLLSNK